MRTITTPVEVEYNLIEDVTSTDRSLGVHLVDVDEDYPVIRLNFFNLHDTLMQLSSLYDEVGEEQKGLASSSNPQIFYLLRALNNEVTENRHDAYAQNIATGLFEYRNLFLKEDLDDEITLMGIRVALTTSFPALAEFINKVMSCSDEELPEDVVAPVWEMVLQIN